MYKTTKRTSVEVPLPNIRPVLTTQLKRKTNAFASVGPRKNRKFSDPPTIADHGADLLTANSRKGKFRGYSNEARQGWRLTRDRRAERAGRPEDSAATLVYWWPGPRAQIWFKCLWHGCADAKSDEVKCTTPDYATTTRMTLWRQEVVDHAEIDGCI